MQDRAEALHGDSESAGTQEQSCHPPGHAEGCGEHRPRPAESSAARNPEWQKELRNAIAYYFHGDPTVYPGYEIRDRLSLLWILGIIEEFLF